eukprot:CAMPEP_0116065492 /NCGR_PEP_ID=MMETSP0322-20121206/9800_1 /TAXON_ID=163516 /ORGANISM="Leptocylindrus danicus var. apora, Strain B651" /LENGTH=174 /DNA_ID=CAMNT_0003551827 /DNA_START=262 /DNA_END=786 /DNA_ORIENTATION=-
MPTKIQRNVLVSTVCCAQRVNRIEDMDKGKARLLADFRTDDGEILDPYEVLRVSRSATISEIKNKYRNMMKELHPDKVMHQRAGRRSNPEEIQRQYHRVKHAYEILSSKKLRARYNRNSFIADPTESITKTAFSAVGDMLSVGFSGLQFVGGEVMKAGQEAISNVSSASKEKRS